MEKISGSVTTLTRAWDNAEPQSGNSRDLYNAGERRLCTGRLQNDFGNDSDPSLHCGVAEDAQRVWDKDDEFKSARARRPKGQCRGNAHKGSEDVSYHCADSEAKGNDPDADDFGQRTPGTQIRSADKEGTLRHRGDRTMVDTVRGGRSRLSCLGLGLVSERALSRLLGG